MFSNSPKKSNLLHVQHHDQNKFQIMSNLDFINSQDTSPVNHLKNVICPNIKLNNVLPTVQVMGSFKPHINPLLNNTAI